MLSVAALISKTVAVPHWKENLTAQSFTNKPNSLSGKTKQKDPIQQSNMTDILRRLLDHDRFCGYIRTFCEGIK